MIPDYPFVVMMKWLVLNIECSWFLFLLVYIPLMYNKDFCVDVSYLSAKWQLKFILSIVQAFILDQLIIDKDIHSFILREPVIFISIL